MNKTCLFVMLVGALSGAVAASESTPVAINLSPGYTSYSPLPAHQPNIAVHGRNIAVLYRRSSLMWDVYSADGGESFSTPKRFIHAPAFHMHINRRAHLTYDDNGKLHLAWTLQHDAGSPQYCFSTEHSATWSSPTLVGGGKIPRGTGPALAVSGDGRTLQTLTFDWGTSEVFSARSTDGGSDWSVQVTSPAHPGNSYASSAVFDSTLGFYAVAKWAGRLRIVRLNPDWSYADLEDEKVDVSLANDHALAVNGDDELFVVYGRDGSVCLRRSGDAGQTWGACQVVADDAGADARPVLGIGDDARLHVAWQDARDGFPQIYHGVSADGGKSWDQRRVLASHSSQTEPDLAVNGNIPHLVWVENGSPIHVALSGASDQPVVRAALPGRDIAQLEAASDRKYLFKGYYASSSPRAVVTGQWLDRDMMSLGSFQIVLPQTQGRRVEFFAEVRSPKSNSDLDVRVRISHAGEEDLVQCDEISLRHGMIRDYIDEFTLPTQTGDAVFPIFGWLKPGRETLESMTMREMALCPNMTADRLIAEYILANFSVGTPDAAAFGTKYSAGIPLEDERLVELAKDPMFWAFEGGDEPGEDRFPE